MGLGYAKQPSKVSSDMRRFKFVNSITTLNKTFTTRQILVGTTVSEVIKTLNPQAYLLANPSLVQNSVVTADSIAFTPFSLASRSATGTSSFTDVSNYQEAHIYLRIVSTSGGGARVSIAVVSRDLNSNSYVANVPASLNKIGVVGTHYGFAGSLGVARDLALAFDITGTVEFTVDVIVKCPCTVSQTMTQNIIYLGNRGVTVTSGFALTAQERLITTMAENTSLFAIASQATELHVLEMGI